MIFSKLSKKWKKRFSKTMKLRWLTTMELINHKLELAPALLARFLQHNDSETVQTVQTL